MPKLNTTTSGIITATLTADSSPTLELQQNGVAIRTLGESQLVMGTAVTASGTSVDFTGIPSWVKRITVMFSGVSLGSNDDYLVQIGDSGGIENTGYASGAGTRGGETTSTAGFVVTRGAGAAEVYSGTVCIVKQDGNRWVSSGTMCPTGTGTYAGSAGNKTLSDTLDRVRVTSVLASTFDAGTVNIMWE